MASGLYLFIGPDRARKLQRVQQLERSLGVRPLDRHQLDGGSLSAAELMGFCRQQPAESPARFIVVDDAHRLDTPSVDALLEQLPRLESLPCVVLFVEATLNARHPLQRLAQARSGSSAVHLEEFPGRDAPSAKPFALTDALGRGDVGEAIRAVHEQLMAGREPHELVALASWQVNRWIAVKRLADAGYNSARIASALGLKDWQLQRLQGEVARRPVERLQELLAACWKLDVELKTGQASALAGIEQLIVSLCLPATSQRVSGRPAAG